MNFTDEDRDAIYDKIAERFIASLGSKLEEVECLTINRVAGILDLTSSQVNKLITDYLDFGPRDRRLSLSQLKRLIEKRTVNKGKKRRA